MTTTNRYLSSTKNLAAVMQKIQHGVPPDKFNYDHLKAIGFGSSNDRAIVPLLKDIGFLTSDGTPTQRYREYRDSARSKSIMAQALRESYPDLFVINEQLSKTDREAIVGRFKSLHDSSDVVAEAQARTFLSLLELADLKTNSVAPQITPESFVENSDSSTKASQNNHKDNGSPRIEMPLTYRFEIQLPATKDVEVFRAIFKALREELLSG